MKRLNRNVLKSDSQHSETSTHACQVGGACPSSRSTWTGHQSGSIRTCGHYKLNLCVELVVVKYVGFFQMGGLSRAPLLIIFLLLLLSLSGRSGLYLHPPCSGRRSDGI